MKKHYTNMANAMEFLSDNKDSVRYKLIRKGKTHVESLLKSRMSPSVVSLEEVLMTFIKRL